MPPILSSRVYLGFSLGKQVQKARQTFQWLKRVPTSGQHRVLSSLQSCLGTLALRVVIKLEF